MNSRQASREQNHLEVTLLMGRDEGITACGEFPTLPLFSEGEGGASGKGWRSRLSSGAILRQI